MSVLVNNDTHVVVQGITGKEGSFHALACLQYGTKVVAGVTPGKGGQKVEASPGVQHRGRGRQGHGRQRLASSSCPPAFAADAILEAADAGRQAGGLHHRGHPDPGHGQGHGTSSRTAAAA